MTLTPHFDEVAEIPNPTDWIELKEAIKAIDEHNREPGFWYLASPYALYPDGHAAADRDAAKVAGRLLASGVNVFSPIVHGHAIAPFGPITNYTLDYWLNIDTPYMQAAIGLIVAKLPSWEISEGIKREIAFFSAVRKPIVYLPVVGINVPEMSGHAEGGTTHGN